MRRNPSAVGTCVARRADERSQREVLQLSVIEYIAELPVSYLLAVRIQHTRQELIAEQAETTGSEVEQRADARIRLSVVITEPPSKLPNSLAIR